MKHLILLCALALPAALHAQTAKTWSGATGTWSSSNWNPGGAPPTAADTASIGVGGSVVTLDQDVIVAGFTFTGGTFKGEVIPAGAPRTLTVNGLVTLSAGSSVIGTGQPMTILANGGISWLGVIQNLNGITLTIPNEQTVDHNNNSGSGNGVSNGTVINNAGTWQAKGTSGLSHTTGAASAFNNSGIFNRSVSAGEWFTSMAFNNTGTVSVNTGILRLGGGGASSGAFAVSSGAMLYFSGTTATSFTSAASFTGAGTVKFESTGSATIDQYNITGGTTVTGGIVTFNNLGGDIGSLIVSGGTSNFNGTASPTALTVNSGTVNFANNMTLPAGATLSSGTVNIASTKTFTIPGPVTWNGTTLSGGGAFFFNGGASMTSGASKVDGAVLNLASDFTVTNSNGGGGNIELKNGAVINNAGLWDSTSFTGFSHAFGAATAFNNSGVFTKRTSGNPILISTQFNNSGTVNVQSSTLTLNTGGTQSGTFNVSTGCTLIMNGAHSFTGTPVFAGLGTVSFGGSAPLTVSSYDMGGTTVTSSTVNFNNGANSIGAVIMTGGTANFNGTASPSSLSVNSGTANFANDITVAGTATLSGGKLNMPVGKTCIMNGATAWTGATLEGGGTFVLNAGGSTSGGLPKLYGSVLNLPVGQTYVDSYNAGGGSVELRSGAVINNAGTWEYLGDRSIYNGLAPMSSFNNTGTFTKRTNITSTVLIQIPFNNSGTVNASAGTLRMTGQSFTQTAGQLVLNGGEVRTGFNLPFLIQGGSITGSGNVLGGVAVTGGTVKPRGILAIQDTDSGTTKGDLTMTSASTLDIELGGTTAGTQHDRVTEQGNVAFARNGQLTARFKNGFQYSIANANSFTILTSNANTTGQFSNVSAGRVTTADFKGTFAINAAGTTSVVLSDFQGYPDIDVEQPAGADLADGAATVDYGVKTIGTPGVVKTFTVKNTGAANLTGLGISIDGAHAAEFAVTTALPSSTLAQEGTTEFIITFTPTGSGTRTAALHIASNDPNEAPFDIALTGEGNFAPVLNLPAAVLEVEPVDFGGAPVTFTVTATDFEDDPEPTAIATPASGSQFNLGDTTVNVTATDSRGATTNGTFIVRVLGGFPIVASLAPTAVTTTGATLQATVNPNHFATLVKFVLDGNPIPMADVSVPVGATAVPVSRIVTGLDPGSTHTARIDAINAMGLWVPSNTITFTTLGGPPDVTTTTPTMITPTKARLTATVNPNDLPTSVAFYVGGQLVGTVNVPAGSSPQTVTFDYQQLIPGQAITFNAIAINQLAQTGVSGNDFTFNLLPSNSTFGNANNFLYAANAGWVNAKPATSYGFRTGDTVCSGFLWGANIGWIHAGTGEPTNGMRYTNTAGDYGVNVMPDGTLRGYAWGQNIGWVNFENTGAPAVDLTTGGLTGYAWSQNIGWINLSTATTTQLAILDTDSDGISDAWERETAGNLTTLRANQDADSDGSLDFDEFQANTNPNDPHSSLQILNVDPSPQGNFIFSFTSTPTRYYCVQKSDSLGADWSDVGLGCFLGSATGVTTVDLGVPVEDRKFYRATVTRPLAADPLE